MDPARLQRVDDFEWHYGPSGAMRVPGVLYADEALIRGMDDKVLEQLANVAALPGIVKAAYAMPDAHWGYGFPIGGVAAFDADAGGVISAGGVGFDISCGVRLMVSDLEAAAVEPHKRALADALFAAIPAGVGSRGTISLDDTGMTAMLAEGARWAVAEGYGREEDLAHIEEQGCMPGAEPAQVSERARKRQRREMGTLGSGNHYLEVQRVAEVFDAAVAGAFGLRPGQVVISIHCGSRGLGHQIGTEYLKEMAIAAPEQGIALPDRELACAVIASPLGRRYLGAMRAGINCAFANRQILSHLTRRIFAEVFPGEDLRLLYDVSHNTCKLEAHRIDAGRGARLPMTWPPKAFSSARRPRAASPRRRRAPTRTSTRWSRRRSGPGWPAAWRSCARWSA